MIGPHVVFGCFVNNARPLRPEFVSVLLLREQIMPQRVLKTWDCNITSWNLHAESSIMSVWRSECEWATLPSPLAPTELPLNFTFETVKLLKDQQIESCAYWEVSWMKHVCAAVWVCSRAALIIACILCKFTPWRGKVRRRWIPTWRKFGETGRCHITQVMKLWNDWQPSYGLEVNLTSWLSKHFIVSVWWQPCLSSQLLIQKNSSNHIKTPQRYICCQNEIWAFVIKQQSHSFIKL